MTAHSPKGHRQYLDKPLFVSRTHKPPLARGNGKWLKLDKEEWRSTPKKEQSYDR